MAESQKAEDIMMLLVVGVSFESRESVVILCFTSGSAKCDGVEPSAAVLLGMTRH
jgi:hypothetical protein